MAEKINQIEIDGTTYDLQDKDAKAPFTGTKAEVQLAIAAGDIKEGDIVNITDDIGENPGGGSSSNIVYLTQDEYDALPDDKLEDNIEYWITDAGVRGSAENVSYDASASGLNAKNVQEAVDAIAAGAGNKTVYLTQEEYDALPADKLTDNVEYFIQDGETPIVASNVGYNGATSGIDAVNVQGAIDKVSESLNIRYNEETDMMQIYFNGNWVNWINAGMKVFDFRKTMASDWLCEETSVTPTGENITIASTNNNPSTCDTSFNAIYHCTRPVNNGECLRVVLESYNFVGGHNLEIHISSDKGNTWNMIENLDTNILTKEYDLSDYVGKEISLKIHLRAAHQLMTAKFSKFEISNR